MSERDEMIINLWSTPLPNNNTTQWFYGVEIKLNDWKTLIPSIYIDWNNQKKSEIIEDMLNYFSNLYKSKGIVSSISVNENPAKLWFNDWTELKQWQEFRNDLFSTNNNPQVAELIKDLNNEWISAEIISDLVEDLDFEKNEQLFINFAKLLIEDENELSNTLKALELCKKAHKWVTQKRPKDEKWLDSIPYSNHPIRVAFWMMVVLKAPAYVVQACLLHDVIEDTEVTEEQIRIEFWELVYEILLDVTKTEEETREEYMLRVKNLKNKYSKRLKWLDRYHNMLRAFGITDTKYLERYIKEIEEVYIESFEKDEELWKAFYIKFLRTLEQLKIHYQYFLQK